MTRKLRAVAYWDERRESVEQCTERLDCFMEQIGPVSAYLKQWYKPARSKSAALKRPIALDRVQLHELLEKGRNRDETPQRQVIDALGFHIAMWSGEQPDGRGVLLDILCGAYGPFSGCNYVVMEFGTDWLDVASAVALTKAMVACWSPAHAAVCSKEALHETGGQAEVPIVDWVFFHRRQRTGALKAPSRVAFELDGGECIVVQDSPIRPDHLQDRARVRDLAKLLGVSPKPARQP